MSDVDKLAAEQAYLHFLREPLYFAALYTDPEAWRNSEEVTALEIFAGYSVFHTDAEALVRPYTGNWDTQGLLKAAHVHYGLGDKAGSDQYLGWALASASVSIPDLVKSAEADYPSKAGQWEWYHYVPKYLGGNPNGVQYKIPAAYHQYITNEFRQLWGYRNPEGMPNPQTLQWILDQVYGRYPLPSDAERR